MNKECCFPGLGNYIASLNFFIVPVLHLDALVDFLLGSLWCAVKSSGFTTAIAYSKQRAIQQLGFVLPVA